MRGAEARSASAVQHASAGVQQHEEKKKQHEFASLASDVCRGQHQRMRASKEHPLANRVLEVGKTACVSLEQWYDGGVAHDESGELIGLRILPPRYGGLTKHRVLLEVTKSHTMIYPVRVDIGEIGADDLKPFTLFHFTHKTSFDKLCAVFQGDEDELQDKVMAILREDYQERTSAPHPLNLKGDAQLSPIEPGKFTKKKDIIHHLFGKEMTGFTRHGHKYKEMADFCFAVRVPASCCVNLQGQISGEACIKLCRDTMEALSRRTQARRQMARERAAKEEAQQRLHEEGKVAKTATARFCNWLCCVGGPAKDHPEFWDDQDDAEADAEAKRNKAARVKEAREVDYWKSSVTHAYMKKHFAEQTAKKETEKEAKKHQTLKKIHAQKAKIKQIEKDNSKTVTVYAGKGGDEEDALTIENSKLAELEAALVGLQEKHESGKTLAIAADKFMRFGHKADEIGEDVAEYGHVAREQMKTRRNADDIFRKPTGRQRGQTGKGKLVAAKDADTDIRSSSTVEGAETPKAKKGVRLNAVVEVQNLEDGEGEKEQEEESEEEDDEEKAKKRSEASPSVGVA